MAYICNLAATSLFRSKQCYQQFVISDQYEKFAIKICMKFLTSKNKSKSLFIY